MIHCACTTKSGTFFSTYCSYKRSGIFIYSSYVKTNLSITCEGFSFLFFLSIKRHRQCVKPVAFVSSFTAVCIFMVSSTFFFILWSLGPIGLWCGCGMERFRLIPVYLREINHNRKQILTGLVLNSCNHGAGGWIMVG